MAANQFHLSESAEWRTPAYLVEAAREVLGGIDLDPASTHRANRTVQADRIFTKRDGGLAKEWRGKVFLNPPGGVYPAGQQVCRSSAVVWWHKLYCEYASGNVDAAVFVAFSLEFVQRVQQLGGIFLDVAGLCVPDHRVKFCDPTGASRKQPSHANAILYLGDRPKRFRRIFGEIGLVLRVSNV